MGLHGDNSVTKVVSSELAVQTNKKVQLYSKIIGRGSLLRYKNTVLHMKYTDSFVLLRFDFAT